MEKKDNSHSITRRDFVKLGVAGTAAASLGVSGIGSLLHAQSAPTLAYRTLGRTGLKVTTLSFGAMLTPEWEVIRAGLDRGINYVDTARRYLGGKSESIVGRAIKGIRDKVYVATKTRPDSSTKADIIKDVETSLGQLQTDHIDVIQIHNLTDRSKAFNPDVREAYVKLKEQGKVRFFGVTTHTNQAEVVNAVVDDPDRFFDTVLVQYNFKSDPSVKQAIARAAKAGIGVIAMKTQAGGYETRELGPLSPHQAALTWVLQDPNVANAIPGMKKLEHIDEFMPVMGMKLSGRDERILDRYGRAIAPFYCTLCGTCEATCPNGVRISIVNRALMYAEGYGERELARETFREARAAAGCADCATCVARCVNGLDIAAKMERARVLLA